MDRLSVIKEMRLQKKTYQEIADAFKITRQRVHQILKEYTGISPLIRNEALDRDKKKCIVCGSFESLEVHHVNGIRRDNRLENLATLCRKCHIKIEKDNKVNGLKKSETKFFKSVEKGKKLCKLDVCKKEFEFFINRKKTPKFCSKSCAYLYNKIPPLIKKERHAKAMKAYYLKNRSVIDEKNKVYIKRYQEKNREKLNQKAREKYRNDQNYREKVLSYNRKNRKKLSTVAPLTFVKE